jgi:hypothetical protein
MNLTPGPSPAKLERGASVLSSIQVASVVIRNASDLLRCVSILLTLKIYGEKAAPDKMWLCFGHPSPASLERGRG